MLAAYFGALALARVAVSLATSFIKPPTIVDLPPFPVDAFDLCGIVVHLQFKMVPNSIGSAFGKHLFSLDCWVKTPRIVDNGEHLELSAFLVMVWFTYREKSKLKVSVLIRTIIAEGTIYFLAMVALQIYIQVSFVLTEVWSLPIHTPFHDHQSKYPRASINNFRHCEYTPTRAVKLRN